MYSVVDKRRVYLACRSIFAGSNAQLRKQKKIKEIVNKHRKSLNQLLNDFGTEKLVEILKVLLEMQIFQSELRAKIQFPELFMSSAVRDVQRAASENEAARSAEEALEEVASVEDKENSGEDELPSDEGHAQKNGTADGSITAQYSLSNLPSLYPSYLPYKTQHLVLTTAQRILEESCFDFVAEWLPSMLESRGWDCPEAVELTKWTRMLAKRSADLPQHAVTLGGSQLAAVLFGTNNLRHSAVHRLPTSARGIDELVQAAAKMAETLQDTFRATQLEDLHGEISSKIKAMELNKNVLEDNLSSELREIQRQREELDRKEKMLIDTTLTEDQQNKSLIGDLLDESVQKIFRPVALDKPAGQNDEDEPLVKVNADDKNGPENGFEDDHNERAVKANGDVKDGPEKRLENDQNGHVNGELSNGDGDYDTARLERMLLSSRLLSLGSYSLGYTTKEN